MPSINVTSATLSVVKIAAGVRVTVTATVDKTGIAAPTITSQLASVATTAPHATTNIGTPLSMAETSPGTYSRQQDYSSGQLPNGTVLIATVSAIATVPTGDSDRTAPQIVPSTNVLPPRECEPAPEE